MPGFQTTVTLSGFSQGAAGYGEVIFLLKSICIEMTVPYMEAAVETKEEEEELQR